MTVFEPVTLIKRFCDIFYYLDVTFAEMIKQDDEEHYIKKFLSGLISGFHRGISSQGIPLGCLIGETYELENGDLRLFAETKNDNPPKLHIICDGKIVQY